MRKKESYYVEKIILFHFILFEKMAVISILS